MKSLKCISVCTSIFLIISFVITLISPAAPVYARDKTEVITVTDEGITYTIKTTLNDNTYLTVITSDANDMIQTITYSTVNKILTSQKKSSLSRSLGVDNSVLNFNLNNDIAERRENINNALLSTWESNTYEMWNSNYYYAYGYDGPTTKVIVGGDGNSSIKTLNTLSSQGYGYVVNTHVYSINQCNTYFRNAVASEGASVVAVCVGLFISLVLTGLTVGAAAPLVATYTGASITTVINLSNAYNEYTKIKNNFNQALYAY